MNPMFYFLLALTAVLAVTADPGGPILDNDGYVIFNGSYLVSPNHLRWLPDSLPPWFVPESENLNIEMVIPITTCVQSSTYWWVTATEGSKWLFISAGPKPDPGEASSKSFFQIKKVGDFTNGYKIMFCSKDNNCINVGIVVDEYGVQRLALCTMPFPITLVKADGTQGRSYIIE
ncbi:hypothetical protein YC2023_016898 [Brassica napus]